MLFFAELCYVSVNDSVIFYFINYFRGLFKLLICVNQITFELYVFFTVKEAKKLGAVVFGKSWDILINLMYVQYNYIQLFNFDLSNILVSLGHH